MGAQSSVSEEDRRTIVAVGVTGAGKSTTCNLISGGRAFDEQDGFESSTTDAVHCDSKRYGLPIRIIDTVGLLSTQDTEQERETKFSQFADAASYGVDVFLFCEKYGRFTESSERNFKIFRELAGDEALKHTILVITHIPNRKLQEIMDQGEMPGPLKEIVELVGCTVGVENKLAPRPSLNDVIRATRALIETNGGKRYENKHLLSAKERREALQSRIDKIKDPHRRDMLTGKRRGLNDGSQKLEDLLHEIERAEVIDKGLGVPWGASTTCCGSPCWTKR